VVFFPRVSHQIPVHASSLSQPGYMTRPSHTSRFYHAQNIGLGV
jgi:hypothetical protein